MENQKTHPSLENHQYANTIQTFYKNRPKILKHIFNRKKNASLMAFILTTSSAACTSTSLQSEPANCQIQSTALIGMKKDDAMTALRAKNQAARVVREGGESYVVTQDYNPNRFNLHIEEGKVVSVHCG